jgi:hypothetical protein
VIKRLLIALLTGSAAVGGAAGAVAVAGARTQPAGLADARVQGSFAVTGTVSAAVNVSGEHRGQRFSRVWSIRSGGCRAGACARVLLRGRLTAVRQVTLTLSRVGPGRYRGSGSFDVAQSCAGHVIGDGRRGAYTVTLSVTQRTERNGLSYATALSAWYTNPSRSNRTSCVLKPAHDAARLTARLTGGLPAPASAPTATSPSAGGPTTTASAGPDTTPPSLTTPTSTITTHTAPYPTPTVPHGPTTESPATPPGPAP